ncbi:MAG TPA: PadR family transcriptional regulator [Solirubrobacteraceae bacterium]|jgi:DNA-binding PadR family transcriptional regulator|nr:PadR family transcriptional regulator [Solirubrobacteraceae bacterium]
MTAIPYGDENVFFAPRRHRHHHHHHDEKQREGGLGPRALSMLAMRGRGGFGPGPGSGPGGPEEFGGPMWFGRGGGPRGPRGGRRRRGDARLAALLLLAEEPRNGYAIMQEIEERSGGAWRASPGSVYPALSQLEDEGLIRAEEQDGRRVFVITDAGRQVLAERPADAPAPWDTASDEFGPGAHQLRGQLRPIAVAIMQVAQAGDADQVARAQEVLADTKRALYLILAGEDPGASQ